VIVRLIFVSTYLVLAFGRLPFFRVDRTAAAVIGAIAMITAGGLGLDEAHRAIDGQHACRQPHAARFDCQP